MFWPGGLPVNILIKNDYIFHVKVVFFSKLVFIGPSFYLQFGYLIKNHRQGTKGTDSHPPTRHTITVKSHMQIEK